MWFRRDVGGIELRPALAPLFLVLALLFPLSCQAQGALKGVALIIGNSNYRHLPKLANPERDARDIERLLNELGFETIRTSDRDARRLSRDLASFVEDAEGADVALLYYAGHGIEGGGENFLVPVDADLSALGSAGKRLVPLAAFIERLKATVPLAIVMLDACRDNPFPPGALIRLEPAATAAPIEATGLGGGRGAAPLSTADSLTESFGTVLAFSAEPGRAALDGAADTASPYAAAVLRHFAAMAGEEFGTVMRMVGEEVYLKTNGRQRPWVNESLRRLLYFGKTSAGPAGEEGDILTERRHLLLTISALPDFDRRQVERAAADGGVPMDALYGMLRALGQDAPDDPAELDALLRAQTKKLKELLAERAALKSTDAEIVRLSALADEAIDEGALDTAMRLHERAKARVGGLEKTVEKAEADIRTRRLEFAEVFARSAETYALAFDHLQAAEDYERAFRQVERWDDELAWQYRNSQLLSLIDHGDLRGDNAALEKAILVGQDALRLSEQSASRVDWALTRHNLGRALRALGERESGTARLEEAVAAYRAALGEYSGGSSALDRAMIQNNLGNALQALGLRESGTAHLEEAIAAFRAALQEYTRDRVPLEWATAQNNLATVLWILGDRETDTAMLEQAVAAFRASLEEQTRDRVPLDWAHSQSNLGSALWTLGEIAGDAARLEQAVAAYRAALEELTLERVPLDWAQTQANLGNALRALGEVTNRTPLLEEAIVAFGAALTERTRERVPLDWANTQNSLGAALQALGVRETGTTRLDEAVAAYRAALAERSRDRAPFDWAHTQNNLGGTLVELGKRSKASGPVAEGRTAIQLAWEVYREAGLSQYDAYFAGRIAEADRVLADIAE